MKIGYSSDAPSAAQQLAVAKPTPTSGADGFAKAVPGASAAGAPAAVTFSRSARDVEPTGRAAAEFDASRVKAIRASIENGTFRINAGAIADKLLSDSEEFLPHPKKGR